MCGNTAEVDGFVWTDRMGTWVSGGQDDLASHVDCEHGRDVAPFGQLYRAEAGQIVTVTGLGGQDVELQDRLN